MRKLYITIFLSISAHFALNSQGFWEIYGGINHSNIIHSWHGQQVLYNHTLNSPLWNNGFQLGSNKIWQLNPNLLGSLGVRIQLKGDKKSLNEVAPQLRFHNLRFIDFMLPINLQYKLLQTKEVFFKFGISGNYLLSQNKQDGIIEGFPINTFKDRIGISGQFGFNFLIKGRISSELMYSQSITNIYAIPDWNYKHQAFELSILYKL